MHIDKLEIRGFGKISSMNLSFSRGLNIIFGENESGKTSIQWFIKGMLFGLRGGRPGGSEILSPLKKYKPWSANDFGGIMEYCLDNGERYRVERNFNTNSVHIFDSLFNDVTGTFNIGRDKAVLFAEKHMGLNEACFDRTVFIRQMESRIDDDGSKELLNRLLNVSQSGFEDISFKKAQKALKDALKSYIGTDKTSTRPLDKINSRLEELKIQRSNLIKKRDFYYSIESELGEAAILRRKIEKDMGCLVKMKGFIEQALDVEKSRRMAGELIEILENIKQQENELEPVSAKVNELYNIREQLSAFMKLDNEDADGLSMDYHKLRGLIDERNRLYAQASAKKEDSLKIEYQIEPLKIFGSLGDDIGNNVIELGNELENLKIEYSKNNIDVLNEKIKNMNAKRKNLSFGISACAAMAAVFLVIGFAGIRSGFVISAIITAAIPIQYFTGRKVAKELAGLASEKKVIFAVTSDINEKISKKQKVLRDIVERAGASRVEDFLLRKASYDSKIQQLSIINNEIDHLENSIGPISMKISRLEESMSARLLAVGIIDSGEVEIMDEYIKSFKQAIDSCKETEPVLNYSIKRVDDLKSSLEALYKKASQICSKRCADVESLKAVSSEISLKSEMSTRGLEASVVLINDLGIDVGLPSPVLDYSGGHSFEESLDSLGSTCESHLRKASDELNEVLLKIREYETQLKNSPADDESIQIIDEEIAELETRKSHLEDIAASLKIALFVLTESSSEIQRDFVPALNAGMSSIISRMSAGKYKDLRADDNLILKTIAPETGGVTSVALLSGGTIDQMYFALRLAAAEIIMSGREKLPVVIDEVFAHYDDARSRETLRFLSEISSDRQIIIFTCKTREIDTAKEVWGKDSPHKMREMYL